MQNFIGEKNVRDDESAKKATRERERTTVIIDS